MKIRKNGDDWTDFFLLALGGLLALIFTVGGLILTSATIYGLWTLFLKTPVIIGTVVTILPFVTYALYRLGSWIDSKYN